MRNRRLKRLLTLSALYGLPALILGWYGFHRYIGAHIIAAVRKQDAAEVRRLLELGANPNEPWSPPDLPQAQKSSLLRLSIGSGRDEIALMLIEAGARTDEQDANGRSVLDYAVQSNQTTVVKVLLDRQPRVLAHLRIPTLYGNTPQERDMYALLRDRGAPITLAQALSANDQDLARRLIAAGADPNGKGEGGVPVLNLACRKTDIGIVTALLDAGARLDSMDAQGMTPLFCAAMLPQPDVARLLIERGASVNVRDREGYTVLMHAVMDGRMETARVLLDHGADPNVHSVINSFGGGSHDASAVGLAAQHGKPLYELLKSRGAKITLNEALSNKDVPLVYQILQAPSRSGLMSVPEASALFGAVDIGDAKLVEAFLRAGAHIDDRDYAGWTPLMHCIMNGNVTMGEYLIRHGADLNITGKGGKPILDWFLHFPKYKSTIDRLKVYRPATKLVRARGFP